MARQGLNWESVNVSGMPKALQAKWEAMLKARASFEAEFTAFHRKAGNLPETQRLAFAYRHGGLAVAPVEAYTGPQRKPGGGVFGF